MKVLKQFNYKEHDVVIKGGFDYDYWNQSDCVKFVTYIWKDGNLIKEEYDSAYPEEEKKFLFWTTRKAITLRESTEDWLIEIEKWAKNYIADLIYKQEMTDGLLNSLDSLK